MSAAVASGVSETTGNSSISEATITQVMAALHADLTPSEHHALGILESYLSLFSSRSVLDDLLAWSTFYSQRKEIEQSMTDVSLSDVAIDWFRVICCFLDLQRLDRAAQLQSQFHGFSKSPDFQPDNVVAPAPRQHKRLKHRHVVLDENLFPQGSPSSSASISPSSKGLTQDDTTNTLQRVEKKEPEISLENTEAGSPAPQSSFPQTQPGWTVEEAYYLRVLGTSWLTAAQRSLLKSKPASLTPAESMQSFALYQLYACCLTQICDCLFLAEDPAQSSIASWGGHLSSFFSALLKTLAFHPENLTEGEMSHHQSQMTFTEGFSYMAETGHHDIKLGEAIFVIVSTVLNEMWKRQKCLIAYFASQSLFVESLKTSLIALSFLASQLVTRQDVSVQQYDIIFEDLNHYTDITLVPADLRDPLIALKQRVQEAFNDWSAHQQTLLKRQRELDEAEKLKRQQVLEETQKRNAQRQILLQFIQKAMKSQHLLGTKNPFIILGISPHVVTDKLLAAMKKKIALLLHPDKCPDPQLRPECHIGLTAVNEAVAAARDLLAQGRHLAFRAPSLLYPFTEDLEFNPPPKSQHYSSAPAPPTVPSQGFSSAPAVVDVFWTNFQFSRFILAQPNFKPLSSCVPLPKYEFNAKSQLLCITPFEQAYRLRLYFSRPLYTARSNSTASFQSIDPHFQVPKSLMQALTDLHSAQGSVKKVLPSKLTEFTLIVETTLSVLNISNWLNSKRDLLQPVPLNASRGSHYFIAAHIIDIKSSELSQFIWAKLPAAPLSLPTSKGRLISLIRLFENTPESYRCLDEINAIIQSPQLTDFPTVKTLNGWTVGTLTQILTSLVEKSALSAMSCPVA